MLMETKPSRALQYHSQLIRLLCYILRLLNFQPLFSTIYLQGLINDLYDPQMKYWLREAAKIKNSSFLNSSAIKVLPPSPLELNGKKK